jgi:hypothetical protein
MRLAHLTRLMGCFRDAYGEDKYARLVALNDRHDPANLFRLNPNIRPSHAASASALT